MIDLGKIGQTPKGVYSSAVTYDYLDVVSNNGSSYVSRIPNNNQPLTNTTAWQLNAIKGVDGEDGQNGTNAQSFNFKGNILEYDSLPSSGNIINDAYYNEEDELTYVFNGTSFPTQGKGINFKGGANIKRWESFIVSDFPLNIDTQTIKDNIIYIALDEISETDVPGVSDKWTKATDKEIDLINDYFKNEIIGDNQFISENNFVVGYNENGVIVSNSEYRTFIIKNKFRTLTALKITGNRFNSTNPINGNIVGIKEDDSYINLMSANTGEVKDVDFVFESDFSQFKEVRVTRYKPFNDTEIEALFSDYKKITVSKTLSGYNENGVIVPDANYLTTVYDNTNNTLIQLIISGQRINSTNPSRGYIIGIRPDNTYAVFMTANNGDIIDENFVFESGFSDFKTIYITNYIGDGVDVSIEAIVAGDKKDNVLNYINKEVSKVNNSITIINNLKALNLYSIGFRDSNTEEQNSTIFNFAFEKAKAEKRNIDIPRGEYSLASVQVKGGVGFTGDDKNTVLRTSAGKDVFVYTAAEAQSFIEANQLGPNENTNQGVEIGHFILSGNGVGNRGMVLNNMAYSKFERIYMVGFTNVCLDMKGVLLCDFNDIQFTRSANGVRSTISDNGLFWSNLVNFTNCRFRFLSKIALDWSKGAGIHLLGCDLSAIGTTGDLSSGVIKLRDMSQEDIPNGVKGIDLTMTNCWGEQLYGGFYMDVDNTSLGRSIVSNCSILKSSQIGTMQKGIVNKGSKVMLMNSQFDSLNVETSNNGITKVLNTDIVNHTETTGGQFIVIG